MSDSMEITSFIIGVIIIWTAGKMLVDYLKHRQSMLQIEYRCVCNKREIELTKENNDT